MDLCGACRRLTSGDCGRHGPTFVDVNPSPVRAALALVTQLIEERDAARAALREARYLVLRAWGEEPDEPSVETRDARQGLMAKWRHALDDVPAAPKGPRAT